MLPVENPSIGYWFEHHDLPRRKRNAAARDRGNGEAKESEDEGPDVEAVIKETLLEDSSIRYNTRFRKQEDLAANDGDGYATRFRKKKKEVKINFESEG